MKRSLKKYPTGGEYKEMYPNIPGVYIKDSRKVRATTGKKIKPTRDLVSGYYRQDVIDSLARTAIERGINPYRAIAQGLAETNLGFTDENIGHVLYGKGENPYSDMMDAIKEGDALAAKRGKTKEEDIIQGYNRYGKLTPNTEKDYHKFKSKAFYGVPIPKEGLDMDKNPLYGKHILDLQKNVLEKSPEVRNIVQKYQYPRPKQSETEQMVGEKWKPTLYANGGTFLTAGNEYHRIYKNADGDIMVNHPKEDKGKWDTINLTDKANAKTVADGVAATKKWHRENPYGYGGSIFNYPDGGKVNTLEGDLISKVIMNRNRNKDFVQRAYALGQNPGMFTLQDPENFGNTMSHKMAWGEDETGQAYMYPTIMNPGNEAIKVPNQYADYISSEGYKKATGIEYAYGGLINNTMKKRTLSKTVYKYGGKLPQHGTGATVGSAVGGAAAMSLNLLVPGLGFAAAPVGTALGSMIGETFDDKGPSQEELQRQQETADRIKYGPKQENPYVDVTQKNFNFPYGGVIDQHMANPNAELELEETFQTPDGTVGRVDGPSHDNGGIEVNLPEGTKIFSDRLKYKNGRTYAQITKPITTKIAKLEKKLQDNPQDVASANTVYLLNQQLDHYFDDQETNKSMKEMKRTLKMANGGMIKRADGSYSRRGLWDNIRANKGSGKKPTKEMLEQEAKIKSKYPDGGVVIKKDPRNNNTQQDKTRVKSPNIYLKQKNIPKTPENWEKEIRNVEQEIGHPSTWTIKEYNKLQNKLNEYKYWRENTPEGRTVIDYHNEPNEYVVPLPKHLSKMSKGGYMYAEGGINNPGFRALPEYVQEKIIANMEMGGYMYGHGGTIPVVDDAGSFNKDGVWVPDWKAIKEQAKKLGAKTVKTRSGGAVITFDKNWNIEGADDNPTMAMGGYMYPIGGKLMNDPMFAEGGKLPKEVLMPRLQAHMSPAEVEEYLDEYGSGGYTVRKTNERKGKTHVVIGPDGTKKYFGDPKMGEKGKSKYGKEAFYARHKKNLDKNPYFRAYARATWQEGGTIGEEGMNQEPLFEYKDGGIYIKPENRGKFTAYAKAHGKGVQEMASHIMANKEDYSPTLVKRANFARSAAKWKHEHGGYLPMYFDGNTVGDPDGVVMGAINPRTGQPYTRNEVAQYAANKDMLDKMQEYSTEFDGLRENVYGGLDNQGRFLFSNNYNVPNSGPAKLNKAAGFNLVTPPSQVNPQLDSFAFAKTPQTTETKTNNFNTPRPFADIYAKTKNSNSNNSLLIPEFFPDKTKNSNSNAKFNFQAPNYSVGIDNANITPGAFQAPYYSVGRGFQAPGEVNMDELDLSGLGETTTPATRDSSNVDDTKLFGSPTFESKPNLSLGKQTKPESWASKNMGTIGQVGAGLAGAALRAYNLSKIKAPGKLSSLDFSSSMYNPDLVDYSANINAANRSAISAMDEAQRGFGSSAAAQAFKNKARLNQLETTGKIYQGQENVNKQLLNEARQRNQQIRMQEQAANQEIARQNMENAYNYNVWKQQQKNQIIQDLIGTTGDVFGGMQKFRNDTEMANILAKARENEVNIDALPEEVQLSYFRSLSPDQQAIFNQKRARLGRTIFEFGGMIRKFPNGGSIGNQYKQSLQTVVNQPTIDKSALMDAEYTAALQAGKDKYKSSVTGLDYKVLPKAEKRALVVDMWRDLHGKAPNQKEIESGVKAIEGKKVSSEKAKEVKQALSSQDYAAGINKVWQPANLTKQEQMMYAQEEVQRDENKVIETLNFYSPAAARYYRETGDLQGALDNFVAPDRFDVSSGAAGYSIGKAVKEGDMSGLDMLNLGLLAASGVNAMQRGPKPLGPKLPEYFENIKRNTELAKQKSGVGKNSYKSKQNKANEARLENWQENVSEDFKSKKQSPEFQSKLSKRIALEEDENLGLDIMDYKLNKQEVPKFVQLKLKEMEKDLIKAKNSGNYQEWAKIKKEIEKYISSEQKKRSLKK